MIGVLVSGEGSNLQALLVARRVTYDQRSGRLIASDGVRMLEPNGNALTAARLDITETQRNRGLIRDAAPVPPQGSAPPITFGEESIRLRGEV